MNYFFSIHRKSKGQHGQLNKPPVVLLSPDAASDNATGSHHPVPRRIRPAVPGRTRASIVAPLPRCHRCDPHRARGRQGTQRVHPLHQGHTGAQGQQASECHQVYQLRTLVTVSVQRPNSRCEEGGQARRRAGRQSHGRPFCGACQVQARGVLAGSRFKAEEGQLQDQEATGSSRHGNRGCHEKERGRIHPPQLPVCG